MKQKSQTHQVSNHSFKHLLFNMIYRINSNRVFKKQTNIVSYIISMVLNLLIFLSSKQIGLLQDTVTSFEFSVYIAIFSISAFTIFQFLICLIYKVEFYLAIQFKITRFIIFPLGVTYLFNLSTQQGNSMFLYLALVFILVVYTLSVLFQSQSYTDSYILHTNLPITSYFIFIEVIFYGIEIVQQHRMTMLFACIMAITSFIIKINFFIQKPPDHIEHKLLSVACFMYCVYSLIIFISTLGDNKNVKLLLYFIIPIVLYYILAQLIKIKTVPITFKKIFASDSLLFEEFAMYAQYLIEEADQFNQTVHSNFCQSLTFTFYSEHAKFCQKTVCKFYSQNWKQEFKNSSDPKTVKKLSQKVIRKLEHLFQQVHKNQPQNIDLKLSFIKFYIFTLPNKIRVLELISEVQNMNKTYIKEYEVYKLKLLSDQMDNIEVIDNLKTDDEVNQFQRVAYLTINSMMEFWMHFSQEKIDLVKVMGTAERLLNYKKQMQVEWQKNKDQQKYSTLKIALLYSYYLKYVLHDEEQSDYLQFSAKALQEKLLHKKQIKYLSFGSQSALIGASLTDQNLGKIVIANNQASNVFNYSKNQINRIDLNSIMPRIFAEQHDHYLLEFHKNRYKRINSDERLLFGKDKHGFIIPILLQLQRTISSMSQELLFVANIRKYKVRETPLICITDQQGQITDISSGFKEVFYEKKEKDNKKVEIPTKNVQEIISSFFEKSQPEDCGHYKFLEKFYNEKYGQMTIEFTVIPICFPLKPNGGFVVMGSRQIPYVSLPLNYLNITKQIDSRMCKQLLHGNRILYNPHKNRYQVDSHKTKLTRRRDSKDEIYTIPFINIHDMTNIFNIAKEQKIYGQKIRTVRLTKGGALVRVELNQTFESEDISETEKVNRFEFKLKQLKYQYLHNKKNLAFVSFGRGFITLIVLVFCALWVFQLNFLQTQTYDRQILLKEVKFRYQVRGYISEYILAFNGLDSKYNDSYFQNKTYAVRDKLVDVIQGATIEETKKQPMFKTVYLRNQTDLKNLISSQTLTFGQLSYANISNIINLWIIYIVILAIFIIFQIVMKCLHSQKIYGVYHVFLGVDEKIIKRSYDSCLKFSQMLQEKEGQQKKQKKNNKSDDFDQENQNPVSRMKKYKDHSRINLITCVKYYLALLVIIGICVLMYIQMQNDVNSFNKEIQIFNRVEGLFPQSSMALMNSYFKSYRKDGIMIDQTFNHTYQNMDSIIYEYQSNQQITIPSTFFQTLMNNACLTTLSSLSQHYAPLCQTYQQSIFTTGLGKVTNHLAQSIQNLNTNSQQSKNIDEKFFTLFQLQYDFYIPMITRISSMIHEKMMDEVSSFQHKYKIWMGVITLVIAINAFYIYQILLNEIKYEIQLVKQLLYFIPDSFIEDKTSKMKKKPRPSNRSLHKVDEQ